MKWLSELHCLCSKCKPISVSQLLQSSQLDLSDRWLNIDPARYDDIQIYRTFLGELFREYFSPECIPIWQFDRNRIQRQRNLKTEIFFFKILFVFSCLVFSETQNDGIGSYKIVSLLHGTPDKMIFIGASYIQSKLFFLRYNNILYWHSLLNWDQQQRGEKEFFWFWSTGFTSSRYFIFNIATEPEI